MALLSNLCRRASLLTFYATTVPVSSRNKVRGGDSISGVHGLLGPTLKEMLVKKVA